MKQVGRHLARQKQITWVWQPGVFHYPGSLLFPTETLVCGWKSEGQREAIKAWIKLQGPMFFFFSIWVELGFDINTTNICRVSSQNWPFPFLERKRKTPIFAERGETTNNIFAPTLLTWRQAAGCRRRRGVAADDVEGWVLARGGGGGDHLAGDHQVGGGHYGGGDHVLPQHRPRQGLNRVANHGRSKDRVDIMRNWAPGGNEIIRISIMAICQYEDYCFSTSSNINRVYRRVSWIVSWLNCTMRSPRGVRVEGGGMG